MLAAPEKSTSPLTVALIVGLTVVMLGAMAFAVPAGPIDAHEKARGGLLIGHGRLTELHAELVAREGFAFLAVDFSGADMGAGAYWREPLGKIAQRGFPIWAFLSLASADSDQRKADLASARALATRERLAVLILGGDDAGSVAAELRHDAANVRIVTVVPAGATSASGSEGQAVIVGADQLSARPGVLPIVNAVMLTPELQRQARQQVEQKTDGDYIIALSAVR